MRSLRPKDPAHLVNAGISFIGLVTMCVMAGELLADVLEDEENFSQVPDMVKPVAIVVFLFFASLETNKVRNRLTKARGFR